MDKETGGKINWKNVLKLAAILFIITTIAAVCLAFTNSITKDIIAQQKIKAEDEAKKFVLNAADSFQDVEGIEKIAKTADEEHADMVAAITAGKKDNKTVGYVIKTIPSGYGGEIEVLTGVLMDGSISGITLTKCNETAGLGAKTAEDSFKKQYAGLDALKEIEVIKNGTASDNQINAVAGATISSKAVTVGVNTACKVFRVLKLFSSDK